MNDKNKRGLLLGSIAFAITAIVIALFFRSGTPTPSEFTLKFNRPSKIDATNFEAYTLGVVDGADKDLTFRCDPKTGEGYFDLKSKSIVWASSHCQDMVGAVKAIEEGKKDHAVVHFKIHENKVFYRVERSK